jgi:hypothetical protein
VLQRPTPQQVAVILADVDADSSAITADSRLRDLVGGGDSAARKMTRIISRAPLWSQEDGSDVLTLEALAAGVREALTRFSATLSAPHGLDEEAVRDAVSDALEQAGPLVRVEDGPSFVLGALGEALSAYHGSINLGDVEAARETVQHRIALALSYAVWTLVHTGTRAHPQQ